MKGIIDVKRDDKAYFFIAYQDRGHKKRCYAHSKEVQGDKKLCQLDTEVEFELDRSSDGRMQARNIRPTSGEWPPADVVQREP